MCASGQADQQQAADTKHARFVVENSDFLAYLRLWDYLSVQRKSLSSNQFRRMCREEFLHYLRIREWQDLHGQLRTITKGLGWSAHSDGNIRAAEQPRAAKADARGKTSGKSAKAAVADGDDTLPWDVTAIHQALLAGMLSHIGVREAESREFLGARGAKFMIFPGSSLAKKPPRWVMAAELVETSRLWGRMAARVEPEWAERLAGDLVKRTYSEPHWSSKRGVARAYERVTLYGVPLVTRRPVDYSRIDPVVSRELFLRHALVQGEWQTHHEFFHRNRELLDDVADLEHRARRRDILVDDEVLFEFYDRRVPADIVSVRHFDSWWRNAKRTDPTLLDFTADTVVNEGAAPLDPTDFPDAWRQGELSFPLTYQFEPGNDDDGVTARIPVAQLAHVRAMGFDWLVPGMREELATALIKTLPKHLRRAVVPAPDFAAAALAALTPRAEPLRTGLARELSRLGSVPITPNDLDPSALPDHLRMTFAAVDTDGTVLARDKNLARLKTRLSDQVAESVARATAGAERAPALVWTSDTLGTVPATVKREVAGQTITGYPALVPESEGVAVRVLSSPVEQATAMRVRHQGAGVARHPDLAARRHRRPVARRPAGGEPETLRFAGRAGRRLPGSRRRRTHRGRRMDRCAAPNSSRRWWRRSGRNWPARPRGWCGWSCRCSPRRTGCRRPWRTPPKTTSPTMFAHSSRIWCSTVSFPNGAARGCVNCRAISRRRSCGWRRCPVRRCATGRRWPRWTRCSPPTTGCWPGCPNHAGTRRRWSRSGG